MKARVGTLGALTVAAALAVSAALWFQATMQRRTDAHRQRLLDVMTMKGGGNAHADAHADASPAAADPAAGAVAGVVAPKTTKADAGAGTTGANANAAVLNKDGVLDPSTWEAIAKSYTTATETLGGWDINTGEATLNASVIVAAQREWQRYMELAPTAPPAHKRGAKKSRGIIMCGGSAKVLTQVWVNVIMLRRAGCKLPIELWISRRIDGYMNKMYAAALAAPALDVNIIEGDSLIGLKLSTALATSMGSVLNHRPYAVKLIALLGTSFDEYLLLDSDNIAVKDPTFLFDSKDFLSTGALFWPDRLLARRTPCCSGAKALRTIFDYSATAADPDRRTFESGQMVLDKWRGWRALLLSLYVVLRSDMYAKPAFDLFGYGADGDKDAFHLGWRALRQPYSLCPIACASGGLFNPYHRDRKWKEVARIQHDFAGAPLFVHKNGEKWGAASTDLPLVRRLKKVLSFTSTREEEPDFFDTCVTTGAGYPKSFKNIAKIDGAQWASQRLCLIDVGRKLNKFLNKDDPMSRYHSDLEAMPIDTWAAKSLVDFPAYMAPSTSDDLEAVTKCILSRVGKKEVHDC